MKTINGIDRHGSQPHRLSEQNRFTLARGCYRFLYEQQNLPVEQREFPNVNDTIRLVLALFPELMLDRGIAQMELDRRAAPASADDNIIHLNR